MSDNILELANNKKAKFDYEIVETFEAGLVLRGTEVKSIRGKKVNIQEAWAGIKNGEIFLHGMNVSIYEMGNRFNHDPLRERKLLLHANEIRRLTGKLAEKGYTLIVLSIYFKNAKVKVRLGLGKSKTKFDKRETIKKREADREVRREIKNYK